MTAENSPVALEVHESSFIADDGTALFYRAWLPQKPQRAMLLFHRGHEHSGRWARTVQALADGRTAFFAWDARGHGHSPGERGAADSVMRIERDMDAFARHVALTHGIAPAETVVLAHSVGAVEAAAWVKDFAPPVRGLILATPAFKVKLYIPFARPLLRLKERLTGPGFVSSYVKAALLTHDPAEAKDYDADPLIFRQIAVNLLLDLHATGQRLVADAAQITVPTLLIGAGADWIVDLGVQKKFFARLGASRKRLEIMPGAYHAIFHERDKETALRCIREFTDECFSRPPEPPPLDADLHGEAKAEYERLSRPPGLRGLPQRIFLRTLARLSCGVRVGQRHGFDSGLMLDYVYENQARGITPLGRWLDRAFLDSPGWVGIRERRVELSRLLTLAIAGTRAEGQPVRIVDVAAGPGRCVLETVQGPGQGEMEILLRDWAPENVAAARALADRLGIPSVRAERGDAFDEAELRALMPRPTLAVVSGLYELYSENAPLRRSLAGLAAAIPPGGRLLYTNQPWHPQLAQIAHALRNREGKPWVMRRRSQAEMDGLVAAAGFEKIAQAADRQGIFTVSLAVRQP